MCLLGYRHLWSISGLLSLVYSGVPRPEYKSDITALHQRVNSLERGKEDKIK